MAPALLISADTLSQRYPTGDLPIKLATKKTAKSIDNVQVGSFLGMKFDDTRLVLVLGTTEKPVVAPMGIRCYETWASLSVAVSDLERTVISDIDDAVLARLSENSVALFGGKFTADQLLSMKFYTPLLYKKEHSDLAPLFSGKVDSTVPITNEVNDVIEADHFSHLVKDNASLRVMFGIGSLFFKAPNSCKLMVKVERIQVLEEGSYESGANLNFEDVM